MTSKNDEYQLLKTHLAITPKTIRMLHDSGYTTPQSLRNATPNEVAAKFAALPGMDKKKAKDYVRPLRRMVMLGDIEDTDEAVTVAKTCQVWSIKHLTGLGVWQDGFDDMTGVEIHRRMQSASALP